MKLLTVVKLLLLVKLAVADGSGDGSDYGEPDDWHPGDGPLVSDDEDGSGDRQEYEDYHSVSDDESDLSGDALTSPGDDAGHKLDNENVTSENIGESSDLGSGDLQARTKATNQKSKALIGMHGPIF